MRHIASNNSVILQQESVDCWYQKQAILIDYFDPDIGREGNGKGKFMPVNLQDIGGLKANIRAESLLNEHSKD